LQDSHQEVARSRSDKYATWQMCRTALVGYLTLVVTTEGYARKRWCPFQSVREEVTE
jgi:hypothetical protein